MAREKTPADLESTWGFPITYRQVAVCFVIAFLPMIVVGVADYQGWLVLSANRLQTAMTAVGLLLALSTYAAWNRRAWGVFPLMAATTLGMNFINSDSRLAQEGARRELMLLDACASPNSSLALLAQCDAARIRPDRVTCDFGKQSDQCVRDLYRDAGWPLPANSVEPQSANAEETSQ